MKIAIVGPRNLGYTAGIDHYVTEMVTNLAPKGYDFFVYCRSLYKDKTSYAGNIKKIDIWTVRNKFLETPVYAVLATIHALFKKYDVIHYQGLGSAFCAFIPKMFGKKVIVTTHALDWKGLKWGYTSKKILKLSSWLAAKFANKTTVVSKLLQDYYRKHYHCKTIYIPNIVNINQIREPNLIREYGLNRNNYILFIGRLAPGKGCEYLIDAFNQIDTDLKLVIAGEAISEHSYVEYLREIAGNNIIFTGWVKDQLKEELYSNAYLFVQPSELEGMSSVLLEAMSYGRCVIVSDIPENTNIIGEAGFVFKSQDVEMLKRIMQQLINEKEVVNKYGRLARDRLLSSHDTDAIIKLWEQVYDSFGE